jgi:hypothetical protein
MAWLPDHVVTMLGGAGYAHGVLVADDRRAGLADRGHNRVTK